MKDYHTLPHPTCPHSLRGAFRLQLLAPKMTSFGIDFEFFTRSRFRRVRVRSHPGIELWGWNSGGGWHLASPLRYPKEVKIPSGPGALAQKNRFCVVSHRENRLRAIFDLSGWWGCWVPVAHFGFSGTQDYSLLESSVTWFGTSPLHKTDPDKTGTPPFSLKPINCFRRVFASIVLRQ